MVSAAGAFRVFIHLYRSLFRSQSSIYDDFFLRKQLTTFSSYLFLQKNSIIDVLLGFKYTSVTYIIFFQQQDKLAATEIQGQIVLSLA